MLRIRKVRDDFRHIYIAQLSRSIAVALTEEGGNRVNWSFGGLSTIILGDLHQFPPVAQSPSKALYVPSETSDTALSCLSQTAFFSTSHASRGRISQLVTPRHVVRTSLLYAAIAGALWCGFARFRERFVAQKAPAEERHRTLPDILALSFSMKVMVMANVTIFDLQTSRTQDVQDAK
ncbi:hypothetical protein PENSPDRAFT_654872 [Peniophora sp. CONT]|nr:hypothetical protein PENSPDRAFT_654872 [Peniophora sp. CONT]